MRTSFKTSLLLFLCLPRNTEEKVLDYHDLSAISSDLNAVACHENAAVASWCDSSIMDVECMIHPGFDVYACRCDSDRSACPDECIIETTGRGEGQDPIPPVETHLGIICHGIPTDEPNFILKSDDHVKMLPLHHCENNALVANWCNEATSFVSQVDCLLLPALDEYVCSCLGNPAACPIECIGGGVPDRKTHHAIRCQGIPADTPNYILE
jgi:hypothetical protein